MEAETYPDSGSQSPSNNFTWVIIMAKTRGVSRFIVGISIVVVATIISILILQSGKDNSEILSTELQESEKQPNPKALERENKAFPCSEPKSKKKNVEDGSKEAKIGNISKSKIDDTKEKYLWKQMPSESYNAIENTIYSNKLTNYIGKVHFGKSRNPNVFYDSWNNAIHKNVKMYIFNVIGQVHPDILEMAIEGYCEIRVHYMNELIKHQDEWREEKSRFYEEELRPAIERGEDPVKIGLMRAQKEGELKASATRERQRKIKELHLKILGLLPLKQKAVFREKHNF
jgi:hypothetical protein